MSRIITERIVHSLLFEAIAVIITVLLSLWVLDRSPASMGILSVLLSF